jgi:hypothetical protein
LCKNTNNSQFSALNSQLFCIFAENLLKRQDFENYNKLFSPSIACAKRAGTVTKT